MTDQVKLAFTVEQINAAIETMAKSQEKAVKSIGQVIVMAAWAANGAEKPTADVANALFKNLRKSVKKDAIQALLEEHCNLAYASGNWVIFDAKKEWTEESVKAIKLAAASWETYKKAPPAAKNIDAIEEFEALVEKLSKRAAKKELEHAGVLNKLRATLGELKAELLFEEE